MAYVEANNPGRTEDGRHQLSASLGHKIDISVSVNVAASAVPFTAFPQPDQFQLFTKSRKFSRDCALSLVPVDVAFIRAWLIGDSLASRPFR
jgi:hypothetical protein